MNYACDLLQHREHTVSQIAEICGYKDVYTFSHQFKIEFGISPTQFIKKYKSSKYKTKQQSFYLIITDKKDET